MSSETSRNSFECLARVELNQYWDDSLSPATVLLAPQRHLARIELNCQVSQNYYLNLNDLLVSLLCLLLDDILTEER